jgi:putative ABC transport system permease protein
MAAALVAPAATLLALRGLVPLAGLGVGLLGRMAARSIAAALSRTGVAIAALTIAVSATIGVGVMIESFREAVARWLETTLRADVYVSAPSLYGNRPDTTLDEATVARLVDTPGVAGWSASRAVQISGPSGPLQLVAIRLAAGRAPGFTLVRGQADTAWPAVERGAVLLSEPYAYRHGVEAGVRVTLVTDRGPREFDVAGVFRDYGAVGGTVVMSRTTYDQGWDDRGITALALYTADGVGTETLVGRLRERAAGGPAVVIRANRTLRQASLEVFDRTFRITGVLRVMIVAVAFVGVLSALMALQLERMREVGVLRALGLTPAQVWSMVTVETGLIGALAGLFAVPLGMLLAAILVHVINRRSFGWSMPLMLPVDVLLQGLALAVGAALLAGLYPARRMAKVAAAEALRSE